MEKKLYAPKATKYIQKEDGLKQESCYPPTYCKWCNGALNRSQIYEFLRGKTKGFCSKKCSMLFLNYGTKEDYIKKFTVKCKACHKEFKSPSYKRKFCSKECQSNISSKLMVEKNPMRLESVRRKVSNTLKEMRHKPLIQGGNGRGATKEQLNLYNEITKKDGSFSLEYIEKTGHLRKQFKSPNHYKIDIASKVHMIAIEVDGSSHNSQKIKECDKRKKKLLALRGWKVLSVSNIQIQTELKNCVKMVLSMISR